MFGMPEAGLGMQVVGLVMMLAYVVIGIGGFVLVARGLLNLSERLAARRHRELDELRRRVASGTIESEEFEARRRRLAGR